MDRALTQQHPVGRPADYLNNRIFFRLFQLGNTLQRQAVKELGVTTVQWSVLGALSRSRPMRDSTSVGELADYLVVSRQSLDGVLKRLERDRYVERVTDPTDRRARQVRLTAEGMKLVTSVKVVEIGRWSGASSIRPPLLGVGW